MVTRSPRSFFSPGGPPGLAYLILYNKRVQLIVGYRGMVQLAVGRRRRHLDPRQRGRAWRRLRVARGPDAGAGPHADEPAPAAADITHAYAIAELPGGGRAWWCWTRDDLEARRKSGASGQGSRVAGDTHYHEMAKKSAIRAQQAHSRWSPDRAMRLALG